MSNAIDQEALEKAVDALYRWPALATWWESRDDGYGGHQHRESFPPEVMENAIIAFLSALADKGLRLVPREPTPKMIVAASHWGRTSEQWTAMFDVATASSDETGEK